MERRNARRTICLVGRTDTLFFVLNAVLHKIEFMQLKLMQLKNGAIVFASKGESQIVPVVIYKKPKVFRRNYILIGEPIDVIGEDKRRLTREEQELNVQNLVRAMSQLREDIDAKLAQKKKKKMEKKVG